MPFDCLFSRVGHSEKAALGYSKTKSWLNLASNILYVNIVIETYICILQKYANEASMISTLESK